MSEIARLQMQAQRKLKLAKALYDNEWNAIHTELSRGPLVLNVPKMVDGQAAPDSAAARAEQTIVASSISDDFTIAQVLRHYGIERHAVTFGEPEQERAAAKERVENIAKELGYQGEVRWDANRPDIQPIF